MKRISILFILTGALFSISFSQGEFLSRGKSGFGTGAGFSTSSVTEALSLFAGYSYQGFLDASLTFSKANKGDVRDGVLTPSMTYFFIKQEDAKDVPTVGVSLGYSHYRMRKTKSYIVPDTVAVTWRSIDLSSESIVDAMIIGVTAHHRIGYWRSLFFQPMISADLSMAGAGWGFSIRGGIAIGGRIVRGPLLIVSPFIERRSGVTSFALNMGFVF